MAPSEGKGDPKFLSTDICELSASSLKWHNLRSHEQYITPESPHPSSHWRTVHRLHLFLGCKLTDAHVVTMQSF